MVSAPSSSSSGPMLRLGRPAAQLDHEVAVHGGHVDDRGPGPLGGGHAHPVHLDVVGMPVAAVLVVDDEDVGRPPRPGWRPGARRPRPRRRWRSSPGARTRLTLHARVLVAEEQLAGRRRAPRAASASSTARRSARVSPGSRKPVGDLAELAPGGRHQHDPVALLGQRRHGAAGGDRLVVGMGVEEGDGGHGPHPTGTDRRRSPPVASAERELGRLGQRQLARPWPWPTRFGPPAGGGEDPLRARTSGWSGRPGARRPPRSTRCRCWC